MKMKIKKGDLLAVTAGKDKGRQGKAEQVFRQKNMVLIAGVNQYKKHKKPQGENRPGEIVTITKPLPVGKLALICPKCKQPTRVGYRIIEGKKNRVCRKCDADID
jgi:large subunit ribosomal protein L24